MPIRYQLPKGTSVGLALEHFDVILESDGSWVNGVKMTSSDTMT